MRRLLLAIALSACAPAEPRAVDPPPSPEAAEILLALDRIEGQTWNHCELKMVARTNRRLGRLGSRQPEWIRP